ncbi:MAG: hypothetical protein H7318_09945 [Oligoflexus sp.]|nr:hypothetical protein [Oligoflexus sp.]
MIHCIILVLLSYFCSLVNHQIEHALSSPYDSASSLTAANATHSHRSAVFKEAKSHKESAPNIPENECVTCRLWNDFSTGLIKAPSVSIAKQVRLLAQDYIWESKDQPLPRQVPVSVLARGPPLLRPCA